MAGDRAQQPQPRLEQTKNSWRRIRALVWAAAVPTSVWLTLWSGVAPTACRVVQAWDIIPASISPCGPSAEELRLEAEAERLRQEQERLDAEKAAAAEAAKVEAARLAAEQERLRQEQESLAKQRESLNVLAASVGALIRQQTVTPDGQPVDAETQNKAAEAVTEIAEEAAGTDTAAETERALKLIKAGDTDAGLAILERLAGEAVTAAATAEAEAAEQKAAAVAQWRRIGELARPLNTAKALAAYEQVVALDAGNP